MVKLRIIQIFIQVLIFIFITGLNSCKESISIPEEVQYIDSIYTPYSKSNYHYKGFHSDSAIDAIARMENEHFNALSSHKCSKYYGTEWRKYAELFADDNSVSEYEHYLSLIDSKPDSMHCTIYALEALKAGFGDEFVHLEEKHEDFWKDREFAGWSVAYILTEVYGWKAYLFITPESNEYDRCVNKFKSDSIYYVWNQPDIRLSGMYESKDTLEINQLLSQFEYGWGFSEQGWHTWVTRFEYLKECNWAGGPISDENSKPLFIKTKFTDYKDFHSHVIVFPPLDDL
jgi:hypothetical protein